MSDNMIRDKPLKIYNGEEAEKILKQNNIKCNLNERYENNKEAIIEESKQWSKRNPEKRNIIQKRWNRKNPDKIKAIQDRYNEKNKEKNSDKQKEWYETNKLIVREKQKAYYNKKKKERMEAEK